MKVRIKAKSGLSPAKAAEILHDGTAQGHPLTAKQKRFFGWKSHQKANDGISIEGNQYKQLSDSFIQLGGKPHSQGGTDVSMGNKTVEGQRGEPISKDNDGGITFYGKMKNPLTGKTFETDAKTLAKKENKAQTYIDKGAILLNTTDPMDKWGILKFNSGKAMLEGGQRKKQEIQQSKEHLGVIQKAMLDTAEENNIDPQEFSKGNFKAKYGAKIYKFGGTDDEKKKKQSLAQKNNNPGNLKYAPWMKKYGAVKGDIASNDGDGSSFAKFPSTEDGQKAMKALLFSRSYKNLSVGDAINKWTGGAPYNASLYAGMKDRKISSFSGDEQNQLLNIFTQGEDSKSYNWDIPDTPQNGQNSPIQLSISESSPQPYTPYKVEGRVPNAPAKATKWQDVITNDNYNVTDSPNVPTFSNAKKMGIGQIVPELVEFAGNRQESVPLQQYTPKLFQPYQVSFQDRRNNNASTFNALQGTLGDNPEALSYLASQKYEADNSVNADEFRTNQSISNDVTNKNISLINDAQQRNLQLADTQFVRQSQARSNTRAVNHDIMNSISSKVYQNEAENNALKVYENLYEHYRFDPITGQAIKVGAPGQDYLNINGSPLSTDNSGDNQKKVTYDKNGNLKQSVVTYDSKDKQLSDYYDLKNKKMRDLQATQSLYSLFNKKPIVYK